MAGTVNISRDLWDDPTFKDSEMSQREAWIWMIADAAWKPHVRRFGIYEIPLERGQFAASSRYISKAWGWSEPRVRRYLSLLENRRMVQTKTDAGVTVVTICKYDEYQSSPSISDAAATHQSTQERRTTDAKENKVNKGNKIEERDTNVSLPRTRPERFDEFWDEYPHRNGAKKGKAEALKKYETAIKAGSSEQEIIDGAKRYQRDRSVIDGYAKDPTTWINQKRWSDEIEPHTAQQASKAGRPQNDRQQFDAAHREYARRIGSGEIKRGPDPSDPFA